MALWINVQAHGEDRQLTFQISKGETYEEHSDKTIDIQSREWSSSKTLGAIKEEIKRLAQALSENKKEEVYKSSIAFTVLVAPTIKHIESELLADSMQAVIFTTYDETAILPWHLLCDKRKFLFEKTFIGIIKDKTQCKFQFSNKLYTQIAPDFMECSRNIRISSDRGGILFLAAHGDHRKLFLNGTASSFLNPEGLCQELRIRQEELTIIASCKIGDAPLFDGCCWANLVGQYCAGVIAPMMSLEIDNIPTVFESLAEAIVGGKNPVDALWKFYKEALKNEEQIWRLGFLPLFNALAFIKTVSGLFYGEICELKDIWTGLDIVQSIVLHAYREACPDSPLPKDDENIGLEVIDRLTKMTCTPDKPLLFEFIERCKIHIASSDHRLDDWENKVAKRLNINLSSIKKPVPSTVSIDPILMIKLDCLSQENAFLIKAWLYKNGLAKPEQIDREKWETSFLWRDMPARINTMLNESCRWLMGNDLITLPRVELILPLEKVDAKQVQEIAQWTIYKGKLPMLLTDHYVTVLRSYERIYEEDYSQSKFDWISKWKKVHPHTLEAASIFCECQGTISCKCPNLLEDKSLAISFNQDCPDIGNKIDTIVGTGLPCAILVWEQKPNPPCEVCKFIIGKKFDDLPLQIQARRKETPENSMWKNLTLLWDNPDIQPKDIQYRLTAPKGD